ncbi:DUF2970 domain-containing protein [Nitrogeniibacter mangrovi]|uniref:DUF2970 domain-containing protein n=1 Tax=Nitrogeniibacter mangrovi TaxID=2016596 RepID=A0A6C1B2G5_9RHOO|nr:DUF2970 domain-containing protein [Nitrogeniibacter mangrovi]QID17085.1 DUF2970 domain-containing protein [Nitrogeniibacter mangrovi]
MTEPVRQAGFWATMRAVLWSFIGVRKRRAYQEDAESLNPKAVIVAGVLGGVIFVLSILAFVRFVVGA